MELKCGRYSLIYYTIFSLLITSISSCLSSDKKKITLPKEEDRATWWAHILKRAEKDHEIYGALDISRDTIILLRRSVGIELSPGHGKTWKWLGKGIYRIDEFIVDDKGVWWGLERSEGMHNRPSHYRMHSSADAGKTWTTYEFNTRIFFPFHINSKPGQPLEIIDGLSNKIYILKGNDASHNWQYVKQHYEREFDLADISVGNYFISDNLNDNKLYAKRDTTELIR